MQRVAGFLSAFLLLSLPAGAQAPARPAAEGAAATLVSPAGAPAAIRTAERDGKLLLSVNDVVGSLGGSVEFDAETRSYEVKLKGHSAVFGVEAPIAVVDTRLVNLAGPVAGDGPSVMADAEFFTRVIGPMLGATIAWDRAARTLSVQRSEVSEVAVDVSVADFEATTKVVLRLGAAAPYRVEKGDDQVLLRFTGAKLVASPAERLLEDRRVARLLVRGSDAVLYLREKGLTANVYSLSSPPRVVVDVARPGPPPAPAVAGPAGGPAPSPSPTPPPAEPKTIVLDPGHGGSEEGAKGPDGILEKDATLALVRVLKETLTRKGYRVVTTRDSDASVGLDERAALSNAAKADLFVSIHCNASRSPAAHGTEVYYLSLDASDRAAAALAEAENRPGAEPTATPSAETNAALRDLQLILWDLAQNQHLAASSRLAEIIQGDFNRLLGVTTRGVKQAPFKVLIGVNAPAVLVEVAFITNPDEEKKLASDEFRRQVAETLSGSLATYFRSADGTAPVPAPPGRPR